MSGIRDSLLIIILSKGIQLLQYLYQEHAFQLEIIVVAYLSILQTIHMIIVLTDIHHH